MHTRTSIVNERRDSKRLVVHRVLSLQRIDVLLPDPVEVLMINDGLFDHLPRNPKDRAAPRAPERQFLVFCRPVGLDGR